MGYFFFEKRKFSFETLTKIVLQSEIMINISRYVALLQTERKSLTFFCWHRHGLGCVREQKTYKNGYSKNTSLLLWISAVQNVFENVN